MRRHDYRGPDDLLAMQQAVQRSWTPQQRWHVGDLAWGRNALPDQEPQWCTSLWLDDGGAVTAWGWVELPGHLDLHVDPAHPELARDVLAWFETVASGPECSVTVLETERHLVAALERAAYRQVAEAPFFLHGLIDLDESLAVPQLPEGYRVRAVREDEAAARAAVHRAAWRPERIGEMFVPPADLGDAESGMTTESYQMVMRAWPYRQDLDQVVEAPDGMLAAFALGWLDAANRVGELEPVGTTLCSAGTGVGGEPGLPARAARRRCDAGRRLPARGQRLSRRAPALLRARLPAGRADGHVQPLKLFVSFTSRGSHPAA